MKYRVKESSVEFYRMFETAIVLVKTKILAALRRPHENLSEKSLRVETNFQGQFRIVSNVHVKIRFEPIEANII